MSLFRVFTLSALFGAACGGGGREVPDTPPAPLPDAPPDTPAQPTVTLEVTAEPALVAFRDEASTTWQSLPVAGNTRFAFQPAGPYRVVVVCRSPSAAVATQYGRTLDDGAAFTHFCGAPRRPLVARGKVGERGRVSFGADDAQADTAPWQLELAFAPGTYDLIAMFGDPFAPERVAVRRDVEATADIDLGTIDATGAVPLEAVTFTPTNLSAGETLSSWTHFDTEHGGFNSFVDQETWKLHLVPAALLRASDRQGIELATSVTAKDNANLSSGRSIGFAYRAGDATEVTLPPASAPVAFEADGDRLSVKLPVAPAGAERTLDAQTQVPGPDAIRVQRTSLSGNFVQATGATEIVVDFRDVPGYLPEWKLADSGFQFRGFEAQLRTSDYDTTSTYTTETVRLPLFTHAESKPESLARHLQRAALIRKGIHQ